MNNKTVTVEVDGQKYTLDIDAVVKQGLKYTLDIDAAVKQGLLIPQMELAAGNVYLQEGSAPIFLVKTVWKSSAHGDFAKWNFLGLEGLSTFSNAELNPGKPLTDAEVLFVLNRDKYRYIGNIRSEVCKLLRDLGKTT